MVLNNIDKLLEKYDNGETSIKEEQVLRDYFSQDNIDPNHLEYQPLFNYFTITSEEKYVGELPKIKDRSRFYSWLSVAAIAILMLGIYFKPFSGPSAMEQEQAMLAYNQTMEALSLVSNQLNEGKEVLDPLTVLNANLTEGIQKANLINEFSETTNIVYNTSNN